jgi:hypothetical protein
VAETTTQICRSNRAGGVCDYSTLTIYPKHILDAPVSGQRAQDNIQELHSWQAKKFERFKPLKQSLCVKFEEPTQEAKSAVSFRVSGGNATV